MPGMRMSMTTTSAPVSLASWTASAPVAASPATSMPGTVMALTFRAELDKIAGDYRGAIAALEEAAASSGQLGDASEDLAWLYQQLAGLRIRTGDYAAAHAVLDQADQNAWAHGDLGPYLRLIRAVLAWREGHPAEAIRLCEDLLRDEAGQSAFWAPLRALAGARLGVLTLEAGDTSRGTALLRDALGTAAAAGDRPAAAVAVEGLATVTLRLAGAERAAALLGAADSIRGAVDHSSLDAPGVRTAAEEQLGEARFGAAYRRGLAMPYAEALGFAQASAALASERLPARMVFRRLGPAGCTVTGQVPARTAGGPRPAWIQGKQESAPLPHDTGTAVHSNQPRPRGPAAGTAENIR